MDIESLTVGQVRELAVLFGGAAETNKPNLWARFFRSGRKVFIRTVTHHYTGEVVECDGEAVLLRQAAWIADDGRFAAALAAAGKVAEVEPYPDEVVVGLGAVVDASEWRHELPRAVL